MATFEGGDFSEFNSINSGTHGTLSVDPSRAYEGTRSGHASTPGDSTSLTKYARGIWNVDWDHGSDVWYGGAIYLPSDFYSRQQGDVDIMRWDNWALENRSQDQSGVTIRWDGKLAMLFKNMDTREYTNLVTPLAPLAAGGWHRIDVRQKLGGDGEAVNELWVDGQKVGSSTTANWRGRRAVHHRIGLVAEHDARQASPLDLWFDRAYVGDRPLAVDLAPASGPTEITSPPNGSYDTDGAFPVRGTAEPGSTVNLYEGTTLRGRATTPADGSWSVAMASVPDGNHTYTAATDAAANASTPSAPRTVIVDGTRPTVKAVSPAGRATGVSRAANVLATFSERMRPASISRTTVTLARKGTTRHLAATISYDARLRRAKLNPKADLRRGATYIATVRTRARDVAGNPLAARKQWSFRVRR